MKFTRFLKSRSEQADPLVSSCPPSEWSVTFSSPHQKSLALHDTEKQTHMPRKCPICLSIYRPDQLGLDGSLSNAQPWEDIHQALRIHRRHSAASSASSDLESQCITLTSSNADLGTAPCKSRRNSKFLEEFDTDTQDYLKHLQAPTQEASFLQVSGNDAQRRRRRRSAISCGSDAEELQFNPSPSRMTNGNLLHVPDGYYHLNGVPMRF